MIFKTRPNRPELEATKIPTAIDIAWSAGIFEGEGTCRNCGRGKRSLAVAVAQKDPELLYRLRDWFGGSISQGLANGFVIHTWNICGDRARIFLANIYDFMTARRKSQIDVTGALDFLHGTYPAGMSIAHLKSVLFDYYEKEKWSKTERAKARRAKKYEEQSSDPEWMKNQLEYNNNLRRNWTPEQQEASRKYQQDYYQNKKQKQLLNVVEIKKTA